MTCPAGEVDRPLEHRAVKPKLVDGKIRQRAQVALLLMPFQ
jgi:hypothetical protein